MSKASDYRQLQAFTLKSDLKGYAYIAWNYFCICTLSITVYLIFEYMTGVMSLSLYGIVAIMLASRWRRFEILVHEASHNNVFKTISYNREMEALFAYPVFLDVRKYFDLHSKHHRLIGNFKEDPDLLIYEKWGLHDLPKNWIKILVIRPFSLYFTWEFLSVTFKKFWVNKNNRIRKVAFWSFIILLITWLDGWELFGLIYGIPFMIVLPIFRFYSRANEHTGVDFAHTELSARNNLGLFNRYILHPYGDAYHQVHHLWPSIPFYNLGKAHRHLIENETFLDSYSLKQTLTFTKMGSKEPQSFPV